MKLRSVIILLLAIAGISNANAHVKFEDIELQGEKQQFTDQLIQKGYDCVYESSSKSTFEGM